MVEWILFRQLKIYGINIFIASTNFHISQLLSSKLITLEDLFIYLFKET